MFHKFTLQFLCVATGGQLSRHAQAQSNTIYLDLYDVYFKCPFRTYIKSTVLQIFNSKCNLKKSCAIVRSFEINCCSLQ